MVTPEQQIRDYIETNNITLTESEISVAVTLLIDQSYEISIAVYEAGHPEKPTG